MMEEDLNHSQTAHFLPMSALLPAFCFIVEIHSFMLLQSQGTSSSAVFSFYVKDFNSSHFSLFCLPMINAGHTTGFESVQFRVHVQDAKS